MAFQRNVFINCPFDLEYQTLLKPLLFTIRTIGFYPRISLERFDSGEVRLDKIKKFSYLKDLPSEKIALVQQDHAYGVISNSRGVVVPIEYTDIVNLGTNEIPLYFTERHISEAGISVVVYYDQQGRIIRKQAMEADEFERISCDN